MTRCSDLCLLTALVLAPPAFGQGLVSDAFGLFDPETDTVGRAEWSGQQGASTLIAPQDADQILIFAGPKSLVAGVDSGQVCAILIDRHGNMVVDGTPVSLTIDGKTVDVKSHAGLATLVFKPAPVAAEVLLGAASGTRQNARAVLGVVADVRSVSSSLEGPLPVVPSETLFSVTSAPLADRYGNPLADGTGASFLLRHADGSYSLAFGITLQDRATASFIARDIDGAGTASMMLGTATSPTEALSVAAPVMVSPPEVKLEALEDISAFRVTLGPFLTGDGYALTDGARVDISVQLTDGTEIRDEVWLLDGNANLLLPIGQTEMVTAFSITSPLGRMDLSTAWQAAAASLAPATEAGQ